MAHLQTENFTVMKRGFPITKHEKNIRIHQLPHVFEHTPPPAMYINAWKTYHAKTACTNCLPDDEPMRLETYRRRQKSI